MQKETAVIALRGKKIFITGGGGFIGSSLAERLADDNRVVLYDVSYKRNSLKYTGLRDHPNVTIYKGDVMDMERIADVVDDDVTHVVHAAAVVGVQKVLNNSMKTIDTNFTGTSCVLRVAAELPKLERFLYFSTSEVFGVNAYQVREDTPVVLGPVKDARWSYSISKVAGEHLVQSFYRENAMPTVIVRPFNIFGPRRVGDHVMKTFILQALQDKTITVHNDGAQIRAWCYIDDLADALEAMLTKRKSVGESFNIGNPVNVLSVYRLAKMIKSQTRSKSKISCRDVNFTDIEQRVPDISKAEKLLDFKPLHDVGKVLMGTIDWYREHLL